MSKTFKIEIGHLTAEATLNDSSTAQMVYHAMPVSGTAQIWGDEIYFDVNLEAEEEDGKYTVAAGDIALWLEGPALCIFLGKTPASRGNEILPASVVNVIGKIKDISIFYRKFKGGEKITFRR
jgi:hypothetical protein